MMSLTPKNIDEYIAAWHVDVQDRVSDTLVATRPPARYQCADRDA
jgi:hypothetical protein